MAALGAAFATAGSPATGGQIHLDVADADVWAWQATVTGTSTASGQPRVHVDGHPVPTRTAGRHFAADVPLQSGDNRVTAVLPDGRRSGPVKLRCRLRDAPVAKVAVAVAGRVVRLDAGGSERAGGSGAPLETFSWTPAPDNPAGITILDAPRRQVRVQSPGVDGEYRVLLTVADAAGSSDRAVAVFVVRNGRPMAVDLTTWHPAWVDHTVVYGVIPPLFGKSPLRAVTERLRYFQDLGIGALWLSPLFATLPGDFGYAVVDYFRVRPDFGSLEDLRRLVAAAHRRGIRVLLDLPLNDTSDRHPYFRQASRLGRDSRYWPYYDRSATGRPTHYFDWTGLPNLGYDDPEVRRFGREVSTFWVRECDVDGYRCDAAWGVRRRRPDFWPSWRAELQRIKPDLLLLAEGTARSPWYGRHGFDVAYDWTGSLGQWAWTDVFTGPGGVPARLRAAIGPNGRSATLPFRFLDDNDTGARFVSRHGVGLTRAAATVLFTLPGMPCIYTGSECGAAYQPYQRIDPLSFADPLGLRAHYRRLARQRRDRPALHLDAPFEWLEAGPADRVLAYRRGGAADSVLVVVNFSPDPVHAEVAGRRVPLDPWGSALIENGPAVG